MKKTPLLHAELSGLIARMGHGDMLVIGDAGLPIPEGPVRIDLAVTANLPRFMDVVNAVLGELCVESAVIAQELPGRIQILVGVDKALGDPATLATLAGECPEHMALTVLDLGYSTSSRHGGLYANHYSGALRTLLGYAANSRYVAYLDDDDWWGRGHLAALLAVQTGSLFSSDSWNHVTFVSAEIRNPRRTIPLALLVGPLLVLGLYLLANLVYLRVLGPQGIALAPGDRVGTAALHALFGPKGDRLMTAAILVSTFGCANGIVLAGSRLYQAMASAGLFFPSAAVLNRHGVPARAMAFQAGWASLLTLTGSFTQLLEFSMAAAILFYILTVLGIFVLRLRRPDLERPVKILAYPLPPLLYVLGSTALLGVLLVYRPSFTWPGMVLVALGVPVYWVAFRRRPAPLAQTAPAPSAD